MRPFHFAVLFWGDRYREHYFLNCWLESMLAPMNLPLLNAADGHKIVVATTKEDWRAMRLDPRVERASRHVTLQHIEIDHPENVPDDNLRTKAVLHQHKWFGELLRKTHDPRAIGSVSSPDCINANNLVARMRNWEALKYDCVICVVLRQAEEPLLEEIGTERNLHTRRVADLSIRHLHQEMTPFIEPVHKKHTHAPYRLWPMPSGYLLHGFFGLPVFMDYSVVSSDYRDGNIDTCLRTGNFAKCQNIHIINDSDEFGVISLTPKDFKNYHRFEDEPLTTHDTMANMRTAYRFFGDDHVRRQMWRTPIRWHAQDLDWDWATREEQIERQIATAIDDDWLAYMRFDMPPQLAALKLKAKEVLKARIGL